jgi:hypothetical protein
MKVSFLFLPCLRLSLPLLPFTSVIAVVVVVVFLLYQHQHARHASLDLGVSAV